MSRIKRLRDMLSDGEGAYISSYANIFYYSGFTSEDARLIITRDELFLITDSRYTIQSKLQSPDFVLREGSVAEIINDIGLQKLCYEEAYLTVAEFERIKKSGIELCPDQKKISLPRTKKDKAEFVKIGAAEALGDAAFLHILDILHVGVTEREIALELEFFMKKNGALALSFDTIVASGVRSAMPHGVASGKVIEKGDFVTMDFGCVLDGYCSDMTRTVVLGQANDMQKEIYNTVLSAQTAALDAVRIGMDCAAVDGVARDIIKNAGYGDNFGHALGHSLGLEIHENPNFSPKSNDKVESGLVITVEPGIYIEGFGGVRIEDVIAVADDGILNLTKSEKRLIEI